jgi:hypothetical protein
MILHYQESIISLFPITNPNTFILSWQGMDESTADTSETMDQKNAMALAIVQQGILLQIRIQFLAHVEV